MAEVLFRDEKPLGKYVKCGNMMYQVVGVYNDDDKSNNAPAYIPFSVARFAIHQKGYGFGSLTFTLKGVTTEEENEAFEESFRGMDSWHAATNSTRQTRTLSVCGTWRMSS